MDSIVFSCIAIAISAWTFYWTVLRPAKIVAASPRMVGLRQMPDGLAGLGVTLFVANEGAKPAHIDFLFAKIVNSSADSSTMYCHYEGMFLKLIQELPKPTQDSFPQPFTLSGGASVTKHLVFISRRPVRLHAGELKVTVYFVPAGSDKYYVACTQHLHLEASVQEGQSFEAILMDRYKKTVVDPRSV